MTKRIEPSTVRVQTRLFNTGPFADLLKYLPEIVDL